jgi:hypothetical protein
MKKSIWVVVALVMVVALAAGAQAAAPTAPTLTAPTLTAPANGATVKPPVTLSWGAVTGAAKYAVQFAKDEAFTEALGGLPPIAGTSVQAPKFPPGATVYWRVTALAPKAQSAASDVWSFTLQAPPDPPTLTAPTLIAPADGATVAQPVSCSWDAVTGAGAYIVQFAKDQACTQLIPSPPQVKGTSELAPKQVPAGKTVYWRVAALPILPKGTGAAGCDTGSVPPPPGPWSAVWSFTIAGTTTTPPTSTTLAAPVLSSPENGATGVGTSPLLEWDAVTGAVGYNVQVASDEAFTSLVYTGQTTDLQGQLTGLSAGTTLYWRVQAYAGTTTSAWSAVWSFDTSSAG